MSAIDRTNTALRKIPGWALYIVLPLPAIWWFYQGLTGGLGPEPIKTLEHLYGEMALQLLIAGLAITPLRTFAGLNLIRFRRAVGLMAFLYVFLHLSVWLFLDVQVWSQIWADILKRPYITIGMVAFALMVPLAVTSNNLSLRRMGALAWRKLHKLTYVVVPLGALHYIMLAKTWQLEPLLYMAAILALLALRMIPKRTRVAA